MQLETPLSTSEGASQAENKSRQFDEASAEDGIDLIQVVFLLWRNKKTILRFTVATGILTALIVFFVLKPTYTAEAVFLPPQSTPGSAMSQLADQMGSLGALGAIGGIKNPTDVYIGILGSRTIADTLIKRFDLQSVYKTKRLSDTEKTLKGNSNFIAGKDSLITISVVDKDPHRATSLANGYLDALYEQNGSLALTESKQRRVFFEQQLAREKDALADAEVDLKRTQEQTGLIVPIGQAEAEIQSMQQLRAQITSRQVELSVQQQSSTEQNPAVVRLQTEIERLQGELRKLENGSSKRTPGSVQAPTAKVPELALEYVRKQREVKYHETLFELLARQYEAARLDESREAPLLQVVDKAIVPDKKSGPPRALLMAAGISMGLIVGILWVILSNALKNPNWKLIFSA
jgi:tyrosine-protein kinase Etk/Wzc